MGDARGKILHLRMFVRKNKNRSGTTSPVFRIFLQHPYKYLNINNNIAILGVAKLLLCLSEK